MAKKKLPHERIRQELPLPYAQLRDECKSRDWTMIRRMRPAAPHVRPVPAYYVSIFGLDMHEDVALEMVCKYFVVRNIAHYSDNKITFRIDPDLPVESLEDFKKSLDL